MKSLVELILSRRSIRDFTGQKMNPEDLETILRAGMAAPSAVNIQPWSFICITNQELFMELNHALPYAKMLSKASAAIIVCGVPDKDAQFAKKYWIQDCSAATENILLAAHALKYGAVWTAVYPEEDRMEKVRKICHIPDNIIPLNVIPIGVPQNNETALNNKYKAQNIHKDFW